MKFEKVLSGLLAIMMAMSGMSMSVGAVDDTYGKFVFEEDSWRFMNSRLLFLPEYYYSVSDYQTLLQNMKNTEKWGLYKMQGEPFAGSCYGMSVLSVLACYDLIDYAQYCTEHGSPTSLKDMNADPATGYTIEFSPTEKEQSLINYYQHMQFMDSIRQCAAWGMYNYPDAERLQMLIDTVKDGTPAVVSFFGFSPETFGFGHAVVAYGVEYGDYWYVPGIDGQYDGRVLIYDPNHNDTADTFHLYFNTDDMSWKLPQYGDSTSIMLCPALSDVNMLNQGGLLGGTEPYVSENPFMDVFVTNTLESSHTIQQINLQKDGAWNRSEATVNDCKEMTAFYVDAVDSAAIDFLLPGEEHGYVFDVESSQELDTAMYYEDSIAHVYAGNANQTVADPSGYAAFSGTDTDYTLELVRNEGCYVTDWYDISVTGHGDSASLQMTEDGYLLTSDNLENVTVSGKNDNSTQTLTFSADAQSVLLYETEYGLLAAAVDADGDGSYEQEIAEFALGDVDENDTIDAADAAAILVAAAKMGAGEDSGLTDVQNTKADVNADGETDASDAALILQYAAEDGRGGSVGSLAEFVYRRN